jgi:hypothetical protein
MPDADLDQAADALVSCSGLWVQLVNAAWRSQSFVPVGEETAADELIES